MPGCWGSSVERRNRCNALLDSLGVQLGAGAGRRGPRPGRASPQGQARLHPHRPPSPEDPEPSGGRRGHRRRCHRRRSHPPPGRPGAAPPEGGHPPPDEEGLSGAQARNLGPQPTIRLRPGLQRWSIDGGPIESAERVPLGPIRPPGDGRGHRWRQRPGQHREVWSGSCQRRAFGGLRGSPPEPIPIHPEVAVGPGIGEDPGPQAAPGQARSAPQGRVPGELR